MTAASSEIPVAEDDPNLSQVRNEKKKSSLFGFAEMFNRETDRGTNHILLDFPNPQLSPYLLSPL